MAHKPRIVGSTARYQNKPIDPQFVEVWRRAVSKPVTLSFPNSRTMQRTRYKLYETRRILEANHDPLVSVIQRLSITTTREKDTGEYYLTVDTSDQEIKQLLSEQGFSPSELTITPAQKIEAQTQQQTHPSPTPAKIYTYRADEDEPYEPTDPMDDLLDPTKP